MIRKRSTALERSVKYFTGGLKPDSPHANLTHRSDVDQDKYMFCLTPNPSMHHLLEHINQDIKKGDKAKMKT